VFMFRKSRHVACVYKDFRTENGCDVVLLYQVVPGSANESPPLSVVAFLERDTWYQWDVETHDVSQLRRSDIEILPRGPGIQSRFSVVLGVPV